MRQQNRLLVGEACFDFGMSMSRWMTIVRQAPEETVRDPSLALLVRAMDKFHMSLVPKPPPIEEFLALINEVQETSQRRLSVRLGREAGAVSRTLTGGSSRQSPAVRHLLYILYHVLLGKPKAARAQILEDWDKIVEAEARARGVEDVFASGSWGTGTPKLTEKGKKGAKAAAAKPVKTFRKKGLTKA